LKVFGQLKCLHLFGDLFFGWSQGITTTHAEKGTFMGEKGKIV
jgi:hypothetical protein